MRQEEAHGFSSKRAQPSYRRDEEKRGKPRHYSANSSAVWFVKAYRHGRLPAMVVVWSHAGAQFFHNLQVPAGFLQRAARVLFMTIVIAGGTGFLGSPLAEMYAEDGNEVRVLTRGLPSGESRHDPGTGVPGISRVGWTPDGGSGAWARALEGVDAVINLSGESLVSKRWSAQAKKEFRDSRILATRSLAAAIKAAANRRRSSSAAAPSASTDRPTIER